MHVGRSRETKLGFRVFTGSGIASSFTASTLFELIFFSFLGFQDYSSLDVDDSESLKPTIENNRLLWYVYLPRVALDVVSLGQCFLTGICRKAYGGPR